MIAEAIELTLRDMGVGIAIWTGVSIAVGAAWVIFRELMTRRLRRRCQRDVAAEMHRAQGQ